MRNKIIITIFILNAYISFGQTSEIVSTKKISLGVIFSPDYCYRSLNSDTSIRWIVDYRDSIEIPKYGFTTGLSLLLEPWNRISFEAGLHYSDKGEKTKMMELNPLEPDPALPTNRARFIYHYYYLDIPVKINYIVFKGKVKISVSAGFSTNIYLYQRTKAIFDGIDETGSSSGSEELSRLNFAVLIGGGIDYIINNRLDFKLEPIFRRSITPIVDAPIKQYQYSIGANFGLYYKLNK